MNEVKIQNLITRIAKRDWTALGKAISIVENNCDGKEQLLNYAYQNSKENEMIVGITGAGGAGKSTVIDSVVSILSKRGKSIGVLAVDPSSSYTGGAVLGDRIRMGRHPMNENLFIRSFGSRGSLGGISQGAKDVLYLFKAFGFDVIILESYGVGQAETDITNFVDVTAVVMAPGNGDHIQLAKAGTQEIADIFVVNKADRPEADALYSQLMLSSTIFPESQRPEIIKTIARDHVGTDKLVELFYSQRKKLLPNRKKKRKMRLTNEIFTNAMASLDPILKIGAERLADKVLEKKMTPYDAAKQFGNGITYGVPAPCVSMLIVSDEKILLGKRGNSSLMPNKWCLPCGYIEKGEDFIEAAIREAYEETHLWIKPVSIINVVTNHFYNDKHSLVVVILAEPQSNDLMAGDDITEVGWYPLDGPLPEMAFKADLHIIEKYRHYRGNFGILISDTETVFVER